MATAKTVKTTKIIRKPRKINRRKERVKVIRMTNERRMAEMQAFINLCFKAMEDDGLTDCKEISNKTGLCVSTIYKFRNDDFTMNSRFGTVQAIGIAAGLELKMDKYKARVALIK